MGRHRSGRKKSSFLKKALIGIVAIGAIGGFKDDTSTTGNTPSRPANANSTSTVTQTADRPTKSGSNSNSEDIFTIYFPVFDGEDVSEKASEFEDIEGCENIKIYEDYFSVDMSESNKAAIVEHYEKNDDIVELFEDNNVGVKHNNNWSDVTIYVDSAAFDGSDDNEILKLAADYCKVCTYAEGNLKWKCSVNIADKATEELIGVYKSSYNSGPSYTSLTEVVKSPRPGNISNLNNKNGIADIEPNSILPQGSASNAVPESTPKPAPTPTLTPTPTPKPTPAPTPSPTPKPTPAPPPALWGEITSLNKTMYTNRNVSVYSGAYDTTTKIGSYSKSEEVTVTGKCTDKDNDPWFRVKYGSQEGFISGYYLQDTKPAAQQAAAAAAPATSTSYSVWVTSNGKKYHSTSTCSNMKKPYRVSVEEAISSGRGPCSKCW